jgi:tetratricopeptide (TPR) repeat protein
VLVATCALGGCVTSVGRAQTALARGDYVAAAQEFEGALAEKPGRVDALVGLGIARYKLRDFAAARDALERALAAPKPEPLARLYLALTYLQASDTPLAVEQLRAFRSQPLDPRVWSLIERSLPLLESRELTVEVRTFIADTLEDAVSLARELQHVRLAPPPPTPFVSPFPYYDCVVGRGGRVACF